MVVVIQPNIIGHVVEPRQHGQLADPFPHVTHRVGVEGRPLKTSRNSSVYFVHYPATPEAFSGGVKHIQFIQIGSNECPDISRFANTCESVEFTGHIGCADVPFQVIKQLPKVNKAVILIGPSHDFFRYDPYEELLCKPPPSPQVKTLEIKMDLEYYHDHEDCNSYHPEKCFNGKCFSTRQASLVCLLECLLRNASESFPNLENLSVDIPDNNRLRTAVEILVDSCSGLQSKKIKFAEYNVEEKMPPHSPTNYVGIWNDFYWNPSPTYGEEKPAPEHNHYHLSLQAFANCFSPKTFAMDPIPHTTESVSNCYSPDFGVRYGLDPTSLDFESSSYVPSDCASIVASESVSPSESASSYRLRLAFTPVTEKTEESHSNEKESYSICPAYLEEVQQRVNNWLRTSA